MKLFSKNMFVFMARTAWRNAGDGRSRMVLFYGLFAVANIVISFQPMVLGHIINAAQMGGDDAWKPALLWSGVYSALVIVFWLFHGPSRIIERRTAFGIYRNFVTSLYRKVTEMPLRWHQDHHSGGTINRVNKAGKALFAFSESQFVIIQTAMRFSASLVMLALYSWWVALISLGSSLLIMLITRWCDKRLIPMVQQTNERDHHLNDALYDYIGNIVTVLTLRLQSHTGREIDHRFDAMRPTFWKQININEYKWGGVGILLVAVQAAIVGGYVGMHLLHHQALNIGSVVAIFQYLVTISMLFFQSMLSYETLLYQHTDVHGVDKLLADHAKLGNAAAAIDQRAWKKIVIGKLNFTHHDGEDVLHHLRNVDLTINAGQKIALVGGSGSGKTTLLTLLRGLYEARSVELFIDDTKFDQLLPLSGFTTLVPQDSEIFENTVAYNLTLGTHVPDDLVQQALKVTTFADVVPKLPQGIYTDIRERGVNLSGGQKQRLALARGLIAARDASLLLMDEPTSSVDLPTEAVIFDRLFQAFANKAIIASIHRLHLLPRFDYICVMQDGAIIEQGSFPDLLAQKKVFYHLWQHHLAQNVTGEQVLEKDHAG